MSSTPPATDVTKAIREGGNVLRCHTMPCLGRDYTVAHHSFNAVSLVLQLHPRPSVNLLKAVAWHDMGERWAGDLPSPALQLNPLLKEAYEIAEQRALIRAGIRFPMLTPEEKKWLSAVDKLELLLWAREQIFLGNRNAQEYVLALRKWFSDNKDNVPDELKLHIDGYTPERLNDYPKEHYEGDKNGSTTD